MPRAVQAMGFSGTYEDPRRIDWSTVREERFDEGRIYHGILVLVNANVASRSVLPSNAYLLGCKIGNDVTINHGVQISDYSLIGDRVRIAGRATIGNGCNFGAGPSLGDYTTLGERSCLGISPHAGANLTIGADCVLEGNGHLGQNLVAGEGVQFGAGTVFEENPTFKGGPFKTKFGKDCIVRKDVPNTFNLPLRDEERHRTFDMPVEFYLQEFQK